MQTFDFPFHLVSTQYAVTGSKVELGNAYSYTSKPTAPGKRVFTLNFKVMKYFVVGGTISSTKLPQINMAVLEKFYQDHEMWQTFIYPHPVYGNLNCKFNKPLQVPQGIEQGDGALQSFSLELEEQP